MEYGVYVCPCIVLNSIDIGSFSITMNGPGIIWFQESAQ